MSLWYREHRIVFSFRRPLTLHPIPNPPWDAEVFLSLSHCRPGWALSLVPLWPPCPPPSSCWKHALTVPGVSIALSLLPSFTPSFKPLHSDQQGLLLLYFFASLWSPVPVSSSQCECPLPASAGFSKPRNHTPGSLGLMLFNIFFSYFHLLALPHPLAFLVLMKISCSRHWPLNGTFSRFLNTLS